jgi:hypothetical protein
VLTWLSGNPRSETNRNGPPAVPVTPEFALGARHSHAFEQITTYLTEHEGLHVLDFGGANQPNVDFFTGMGHRLYSEDLLRSADTYFETDELAQRQVSPARIENFVDLSLDFADQSTDAAMCWDVLQFVPSVVSAAIVERLYRTLAPDSFLLAYFHPEAAPQTAFAHLCRVVDRKTLVMRPRGSLRQIQPYNNRSIERLFGRFRAVKFFLTRDHLREIIVQR